MVICALIHWVDLLLGPIHRGHVRAEGALRVEPDSGRIVIQHILRYTGIDELQT